MPNKQTSIYNFNIGLQNNFLFMAWQSLSIKLVTQKLFSQNMEIHKKKILLNAKKQRCILNTNKNSLKILKEDEYRLLTKFKVI